MPGVLDDLRAPVGLFARLLAEAELERFDVALGAVRRDGRGEVQPERGLDDVRVDDEPGRAALFVRPVEDDAHAENTVQALRFGERCALVSNVQQTVAASSASEALKAIDATLKQCEASLEGLRKRKKTALPAFRALQDRIQQLSQRRRAIADVARSEQKMKQKQQQQQRAAAETETAAAAVE